jgi:hypothetical protein
MAIVLWQTPQLMIFARVLVGALVYGATLLAIGGISQSTIREVMTLKEKTPAV